ncbi:MAG: FtsX-like permease family protein, partial [Acidobacteriota bacterium]
ETDSGPEVYLPVAQTGDYGSLDLVVRSELPLDAIRGGVAAAIRSVDPSMPTHDVSTMVHVVDRAVSPRRFTLTLLSGFAAVAVLLAALGIYGVLSYSVAERSREIAIRMALGESAGQVRGRVLGRTLGLAGLGAVIGVFLSMAASRFVTAMLFGIGATHTGTLLTIPLLLLAVAALAGLLPALRASKVDALRVLQAP